ncbi:MAG: alpha/beta hydrolase [Clostridiales bacterium]|nr:alpha/beta hydrolase [Clostridiales bacterium]
MNNIEEKTYKGYKRINFILNGYTGSVIVPKKAERKRRWIWRAEFLGDFDKADMELVKQGWHLVYYRISDMYGSPKAVKLMDVFNRYIIKEFNLFEKTVLFGFSRGGLYAVNYAIAYPNRVASLYLDAPVIDLQSWPGVGHNLREECLRCYGFDEKDAKIYSLSQLSRAKILAEQKIPILVIIGDSDLTVPYKENAKLFIKEYKKTHDDIKVIIKKGCGHHPHSLDDISPIIEFIS